MTRRSALLGVAMLALRAQPAEPALELQGKIPLPNVHGRMDHLAADFYNGRLFLAARGNNSVEAIDVRTNTVRGSIQEVLEPQGVAYVHAAERIFVTNSGDGSVRIFDGATLEPLNSVHVGSDPDNIRVDEAHNRVLVGYGDGGLAVLDFTGKLLAGIALKGHPESFQLAVHSARIFINVPAAHSIVVVDSRSLKVIGEWPVRDGLENFPMALDEEKRRVFVACRRPARLLVLDLDSGAVVARLATVGDADDLFYDPIHARVYVIGGLGKVAVYAQQTADRYSEIDSVGTVAGARTGLFVAEWNRLFVAVREFAGHAAEIRIYQPR